MECKYTSDGRKVVVVGKLNAQETIVQEIFVSDSGVEVASGENFVVKSLHDTPVESWKEKNLRELEQRYDEERKRLGNQADELRKQQQTIKRLIDDAKATQKNLSMSELDLLFAFLSGEITHIVGFGYDYKIQTFIEAVEERDGWNCDLKLLSLFGNAKGQLSWGINRWSDGSGGYDTIIPCRSLEEAKQIVTDRILSKKSIDNREIEAATKYGLSAPTAAQKKKYYSKVAEEANRRAKESYEKAEAEKKKAMQLQLEADSI